MNKLSLFFNLIRELGLKKPLLMFGYKVGLLSGHYKRKTQPQLPRQLTTKEDFKNLFSPPSKENQNQPFKKDLGILEADKLCQGHVCLFGSEVVPMNLKPTPPLNHWTAYERKLTPVGNEDIKVLWEPARFSWAFKLARAYALTQKEAYVQTFWRYFGIFQLGNPAYYGPNWMSAQEAGLRILAFVFCDQLFASAGSTMSEYRQALARAIAENAERIPPTMVYARAQNNNHLISEAVGLYTAGLYLPKHPHALRWKRLGWKWFNHAIQKQISLGGTYIQHSVNYHRLMLQLALWMQTLTRLPGASSLPDATMQELQAATKWMHALTDAGTGQVPNLGANDGSHILPLSSLASNDYRSTLQAAGRAFLKKDILPEGAWDELSTWLGLPEQPKSTLLTAPQAPDMPRLETDLSRAFLRATTFKDRPSHADQLHVDLWFKGKNIALDPGTFSYNNDPPWQNALSSTLVHNTVSIDENEQMLLVSRFLWLRWAQAHIIRQKFDAQARCVEVVAEHNGYKRQGWIHRRELSIISDTHYAVKDTLIPIKFSPPHGIIRLAWLLPDKPWELSGQSLTLNLEPGFLTLYISGADNLSIIRAGTTLVGPSEAKPTWGWNAITYRQKQPALHLVARVEGSRETLLSSEFVFSDKR